MNPDVSLSSRLGLGLLLRDGSRTHLSAYIAVAQGYTNVIMSIFWGETFGLSPTGQSFGVKRVAGQTSIHHHKLNDGLYMVQSVSTEELNTNTTNEYMT